MYAHDIVLFVKTLKLNYILTIVIDKTHTLAYNVSEDVMSSKSLILKIR